MIVDQLERAAQYRGLNARIDRALEYLQSTDFASMEPGKYELDGENLYVMVQCYTSKTAAEWSLFEAHRKYIDVQYVVDGNEQIGYADLASLAVEKAYDEQKDAILLKGDGDFIAARPGTFFILWPEDAHLPGRAPVAPQPMKKVVIKVKI